MELSYSIVSALVRREIDLVAALARESGRLEQRVTDADRAEYDPPDRIRQLPSWLAGHNATAPLDAGALQ